MILLTEILNDIQAVQVVGNSEQVYVESVTNNSTDVNNGSVFIAIKGFKVDGHKFIPQAISNGARVIVVEEGSDISAIGNYSAKVVAVVVKDTRLALAHFSHIVYGKPSSKLNLIGVTGTKGKTTTAFLIKNIFDKCNNKFGLIGTIANYVGDKEIPTKLTTPESNVVNKLMSDMVAVGCSGCVMETSSHSLYLNRTAFLNFNIAVFTNLESDHMDFHQTREEYLKAKKILFDNLSPNSFAVINCDDEASEKIVKDCKAKIIKIGLSESADYRIENINYDLSGTSFTLVKDEVKYGLKTKLIGHFNAYNATAAFVSAHLSGLDPVEITEALKVANQVPGRFEVIVHNKKSVIIDYAHTSASLEKALEAVHHLKEDNQSVYTVVGCGGDRDKSKRPEMGNIASENSTIAVITSDNPRNEVPGEIIDDVIAGIIKDNYVRIEDRKKAIEYAIKESEDNAVILIAGKGHEEYQEVKGIRTYFSDKNCAMEILGL